MIHYVKREDLEVEKYNDCIENAIQSRIYAFSWYLDIVADNWDVLVLNDYEAVMPVPFRRKFGINYVYPPLWMIELGVFSKYKNVRSDDFILVLQTNFKFVELRLNTHNSVDKFKKKSIKRYLQFLPLKDDYDTIFKKYNRNRKREIAKAKKFNLVENWNDNPQKLIQLFKENIANRLGKVNQQDFDNLLQLINLCLEKNVGDLLTIYSDKKELVSAAFFIKHKNKVTQVVCASDLKNRDNGANTFSNDCAIFRYQKHFDIYNFGGSSIKSIAKYYKSYGAETEEYYQIKYNNLPYLIKLFKR